jgi:hypothetical protein
MIGSRRPLADAIVVWIVSRITAFAGLRSRLDFPCCRVILSYPNETSHTMRYFNHNGKRYHYLSHQLALMIMSYVVPERYIFASGGIPEIMGMNDAMYS